MNEPESILLADVLRSKRVLNILVRQEMRTLADLLKTPTHSFRCFRHLGRGSLDSIKIDLLAIGVDWDYRTDRQKRSVSRLTSKPYEHTRAGFVYLLHSPRMQAYKIGFSNSPKSRVADIRRNIPDIELIYSISTTGTFEWWLHSHFTQSCIGGELFELTSHDVKWITSGLAFGEFGKRAESSGPKSC